jgi:hypothetical protein
MLETAQQNSAPGKFQPAAATALPFDDGARQALRQRVGTATGCMKLFTTYSPIL